ncbi:type IV secretory system conjugative DNA transfer family protein [Nocardia sp. CA-119907]|uniref:type IV secretory system conjugative DNA transfer family protein n=1 Tax=Nocardia sp. CA-119907 TaxID=3239973 RepID=UPI003D963085
MTDEQLPLPLAADTLVWQYILWPSPFREATALGLLTKWAAEQHAPQLILEARSDNRGIEYLVGSQLRHATAVRRSVEQLVPGSVVVNFDGTDRADITTARRLKLTATDWPIEPADRVASERSILGAMTAPRGHERLVLQVILGPRRQPTLPPLEPTNGRQTVISKVFTGIQSERRPDARQALTRKLGQFGFQASLRIGVDAPSAERRKVLLLGLAAAVGTVEGAGVHLRLTNEKAGRINQPRSHWPLFMPSQRLSVPEISHLVAWPISDQETSFPGQPPQHPKPVRPTPAVQTGERILATANAPGAQGTIGYSVVDSMRHLWTMGPSGVGKSSLFLNLIVNDMEAGRPVVVIEPKDLVADVLARIPEHRKNDVVLLDPLDSAPIGINPLDGSHRGGRTPQVVADSLFSMFKAIYGDSLGHRSADILRNSLEVLARRDDASLVMLPLLLTNSGFRRSLTQQVIREDPYAAGPFWAWYDSLSPEASASIIAPLSNKLRPLMTKQLRAVLAQRNPKFNIRQVLNENKILLVPLQKGVIGPESAQLLAAAVLYELWQSILERAGTPENSRTPVMVYVDEVSEFLRFSDDLAEALALARSLRAGFHLAHQHIAQLPKSMLEAFKNNARSKVFFQLQPDDAKIAVAGQSKLSIEDFTHLPAYSVYTSVVRDNSVQPWASGATIPPPPKTSDPNEIRRLSRKRYGQPLDEIEAGFAELLDPTSDAPTAPRRRRRQP